MSYALHTKVTTIVTLCFNLRGNALSDFPCYFLVLVYSMIHNIKVKGPLGPLENFHFAEAIACCASNALLGAFIVESNNMPISNACITYQQYVSRLVLSFKTHKSNE